MTPPHLDLIIVGGLFSVIAMIQLESLRHQLKRIADVLEEHRGETIVQQEAELARRRIRGKRVN